MGYFNYFIKCIIRNIAYRLCKPKVLLTVLLSIAILFVLHSTGYCAEWSEEDIIAVYEGFATVTQNQSVIITQLGSIGVDVTEIEAELKSIQTEIDNIGAYTSNINNNIITILNRLNTLNTNVMNIYNKLDENQKELINTIEENNDEVVGLLTEIKSYLAGDTIEFSQDYNTVSNINMSSNTFTSSDWTRVLYFPYDKNYSYIINVSRGSTSGNEFNCIIGGGFSVPTANNSYTYVNSHSINPSETYKFTVNSGLNFDYIYIRSFTDLTVSIVGNNEQSGLNGLNSSINQGNQLQQEQNQLQQEQNDFLKDDNVNTEGFEFATDDTVNPTTDGFNTLFTSIYNAFCNTSSEPLTVTLPYINETFTIQPNLVSNAMQKSGLGFIATLIHSFYYYGVCLFIYKDINKIIEHLKSGNLTADCGNVKTEVL